MVRLVGGAPSLKLGFLFFLSRLISPTTLISSRATPRAAARICQEKARTKEGDEEGKEREREERE